MNSCGHHRPKSGPPGCGTSAPWKGRSSLPFTGSVRACCMNSRSRPTSILNSCCWTSINR
jgi:hypothetical protein